MSLILPSKLLRPPNAYAHPVFVPEELIVEVLSFLTVKSLTRLKCVSKSFNTLISDRKFIKLHLNRFSPKADRTLVSADIANGGSVSFTAFHMLENPPNNITTVLKYPYHQPDDKEYYGSSFVLGSCNGLLCLAGYSYSPVDGCSEWWFRFWNPATRTISKKLGSFSEHHDFRCFHTNFSLGYDKSKDIFKLVCFFSKTTNIRILCSSNNVWRNIQNSPVAYHKDLTDVVHLSGTINWLAFCNYLDYYYSGNDIAIEEILIISLDLSSETHTKLLPPQGFDEVPFVKPNISVLNDCLCFSHDFKQTHFVIWLMKEFGVVESWTQSLKVSYHNLQKDIDFKFLHSYDFPLTPVCLSEKNDTVLLINDSKRREILFNWRDNRTTTIDYSRVRYNVTLDYVESLVSYC